MGIYEDWLLPRLLDLAMRNREVARYRATVIPNARGRVLEVGIGSGLNLPFYSGAVERLYALDPSEALLRMARKRAPRTAFPVEFLNHSAHRIPLEDGSVDTVVMTWTLCTIPDPAEALGEMRRVLKPGGQLIFAEHGFAPDPRVQAWQHRLNPLWKRIAGGCNLDRRIDRMIRDGGFVIRDLEQSYAKGPKPFSYVYSGYARPV